MKPSIKAALLSALVFPGAGHLLLKKYPAAAALATAASMGAYLLITQAFDIALTISAKIQNGEIPLDPVQIITAINQHTSIAQSQTASIATWVIIIAWVIGIVDAYRLGDREQNPAMLS